MSEGAVSPKVRLLVVDDHEVVRIGLRGILAAEPDMEVVAEAHDGRGAIEAFVRHRPDVVITDMRLPDIDGAAVTRAILERAPHTAVVILTSYEGEDDAARALKAGARGYVLKGTFSAALCEVIRCVHAGRTLIDPEMAARLAEHESEVELSARERQVLALVAKGLTNKEIAALLLVQHETIKTHLKAIFTKLGATDRTEATAIAIRKGIVRVS